MRLDEFHAMKMATDPEYASAWRLLSEPGAYEIKGDGETTGCCAGCRHIVNPNDSYVIRYHPSIPGGIFHAAHAPTGDGWFGVEEGE
jgi:hypothetical protein